MERREQAARLSSLQKLRQRRNRSQKEKNGEDVSDEESRGGASVSENEEVDSDNDDMSEFIEPSGPIDEESTPTHKRTGPSISTFFRPVTGSVTDTRTGHKRTHVTAGKTDSSALKDDFFQSLVAQLSASDAESEDDKDAAPGPSRVSSGAASQPPRKETRLAETPETPIEPELLNANFPALPAENALQRLALNNARCMEIDFDFDPDESLLLNAEELQQLEAEIAQGGMSVGSASDFGASSEGSSSSAAASVTTARATPVIPVIPAIPVTPATPTIKTLSNAPIVNAPTTSAIPMMDASSASSFGMVAAADDLPTVDGDALVYWFDAYERQPSGPVYLFGKLRDPAAPGGVTTCCVIVENIVRNVYFLPREQWENEPERDVTFDDLCAEVGAVAERHGITRFGCKRVTRRYAFELPNVPVEAEYLKLVYGFGAGPSLPLNLTGRTFSHAFGTNTSALELFLVKRRVMGPCWLRVRNATLSSRSVSWCRTELTVTDPKLITVFVPEGGAAPPPPPPMTALALSLRTIPNPSTHVHEIVAVSGLVYSDVDIDGGRSTAADRPRCSAAFSVVCDPEGVGFSAKFSETIATAGQTIRVEQTRNERALLHYLIAMLQRHDPDILVGHNFLGFDLGVLLNRMRACRVDFWSKLGRLNWSQWPRSRASSNGTEASYAERQIVSGRLVCDTYLGAKDLVRAKNYSLGTLAESQLGLQRAALDYERIRDHFATPELVLQLLAGNETDAYYIAMLMFQMLLLPLTLQLTTIAGNLWSRTLTGARAERNEFLLLHEFHNHKFICPDKQPFHVQPTNETADEAEQPPTATRGRRKPAYAGGLVLEPKRGFYDKIVLLLDFNSLYPSIIQEYNICFTSVERGASTSDGESMAIPPVPDAAMPPGILPRILKTLVERRRAVKSLMKNEAKLTPALHASLNIRQQALKLTANSMYGCLGFSHSRFYAKPLAMLITAKGREILQNTVALTSDVCQLDVIYGDTDSIMVNTRTNSVAEARLFGQKIKKTVNERYRLLEIELDGIFQRLLLLKKKKYAALVVEEERADGTVTTRLETKGLDLVRRDWCELSVEASSFILDAIMRSEDGDQVVQTIHASLRQVAADLEANRVPLEKFVISKNLTKDPTAYADAKSQPHVAVALRMRQRGLVAAAGDTIPYVICQTNGGGGSGGLAECAHHPDEVRKDGTLRLDHAWYLQTQLHPPIVRLCEHIEGTDSAQLAACLGLDPRKFRAAVATDSDASLLSGTSASFASLLSDEERFANVDKLQVTCPHCQDTAQFAGVVKESGGVGSSSALELQLQCGKCTGRLPTTTLYYAVAQSLRQASDRYHACWMRCDEVGCGTETERLGVYDRRCVMDGCRGTLRPLLPAAFLYTHLLYLRSLFATERVAQRLAARLVPADTRLLQQLATEMEPVRFFIEDNLRSCSYPVIDFKSIFSFLVTAQE